PALRKSKRKKKSTSGQTKKSHEQNVQTQSGFAQGEQIQNAQAQGVATEPQPQNTMTQETQRLTESVAQRKTYYGVDLDHALWTRAESRCEFVDKETGRRCACRFGLERDHIVPLAMGGSNELSNLRLLCRTHNDLEARRHFGNAKIDREIQESRKPALTPRS